jgi:hypothetical protein
LGLNLFFGLLSFFFFLFLVLHGAFPFVCVVLVTPNKY